MPDSTDFENLVDGRLQAQTYVSLLRNNREFRLFLTSYLITHCGEWLTYVASIALIEDILGNKISRTAIAGLVMTRLLPNVVLSCAGGVLADARDRRQSMILLDILGALSALLFLVAYHARSITVIYLVSLLQQCVAALYEPCRSAIVPLMVTNERDLKLATTLAGLAWSLMTAVGSALGGVVVAYMGYQACFVIDSLTYLSSASIIYLMKGDWNAVDKSHSYDSLWDQVVGMTVQGYSYIQSVPWGPLVALKGTAALIYGAADVVNVSFSERSGNADLRLGTLFAMTGIGCVLGPLLADPCTPSLRSLQVACIVSMAILSLGFLGMGLATSFLAICVFNIVRSAGSSINWIDSSVLLQTFASPEKMGRVLALDYAVALLTETASALLAGILQDQADFTAEQVSLLMAAGAASMFLSWSVLHLGGGGAASIESSGTKGEHTPLRVPNDAVLQ